MQVNEVPLAEIQFQKVNIEQNLEQEKKVSFVQPQITVPPTQKIFDKHIVSSESFNPQSHQSTLSSLFSTQTLSPQIELSKNVNIVQPQTSKPPAFIRASVQPQKSVSSEVINLEIPQKFATEETKFFENFQELTTFKPLNLDNKKAQNNKIEQEETTISSFIKRKFETNTFSTESISTAIPTAQMIPVKIAEKIDKNVHIKTIIRAPDTTTKSQPIQSLLFSSTTPTTKQEIESSTIRKEIKVIPTKKENEILPITLESTTSSTISRIFFFMLFAHLTFNFSQA